MTRLPLTAIICLMSVSTLSAQPAAFAPHLPATQNSPALPTAAVLDFSVALRVAEQRDCCTRLVSYTEEEAETGKDSRGWWLNRQDIYVNSNIGRIAADLIADRLRTDCVFRITSRADLKNYYADKKDVLRGELGLSDDELKKAILLLDPVRVGRELGVQKVIVGHICDSELQKDFTPGSFTSVASLSVAIFDVASETMQFEKCYIRIREHSTQYFHYEKIAAEISAGITLTRTAAMSAAGW